MTSVILLKKGSNDFHIKQGIIKATDHLIEIDSSEEKVKVIAQGWEKDARHVATIPAVKKIFERSIDLGLLGLLATFDQYETAKEVYCMAYCKAKIKSGQIQFTGFVESSFREKVKDSSNAYEALIEE